MESKKIVGIVGGVGPAASNKFCELLIKNKKASIDQENIPFIHYCNPQISDRTDYALHGGENPIPEIIQTCNKLKHIGADFLIIPCNTAHLFLQEIQESVDIPIIDMIKLLVNRVKKDNPSIKKIGILGTSATVKLKLYERYFNLVGIKTIVPNDSDQEKLVMKGIYSVKAGKNLFPKKLLKKAAENLIKKGAEGIVLGCTEIPLVLNQKDFNITLYDPMDITAKEIILYLNSLENLSASPYSSDLNGIIKEVINI